MYFAKGNIHQLQTPQTSPLHPQSKPDMGKEKEEKVEDVQVPADARVLWFEGEGSRNSSRSARTCEMFPNHIDIIYRFLDKNVTSILFYFKVKDDLLHATVFPAQLENWSTYFIKRRAGAQIT